MMRSEDPLFGGYSIPVPLPIDGDSPSDGRTLRLLAGAPVGRRFQRRVFEQLDNPLHTCVGIRARIAAGRNHLPYDRERPASLEVCRQQRRDRVQGGLLIDQKHEELIAGSLPPRASADDFPSTGGLLLQIPTAAAAEALLYYILLTQEFAVEEPAH